MMPSLKKEEAYWLLLTKRQEISKWSVVVDLFCGFLVCSCECIVIWYQSYMSLSLYMLSTYLVRQTFLVLIGDILTYRVIARRSNLCSMWNSSNLGPQVVNFNSWKLWISWHLCLPTRKYHIKFLCHCWSHFYRAAVCSAHLAWKSGTINVRGNIKPQW